MFIHFPGGVRHRLESCPTRYVTSDVWQLLELSDLAEHGAMPVAGGVLDQGEQFIQAHRFCKSERSHRRNRDNPFNGEE